MGNSLVKISVVIPVYNVEPYLVRCLETVVAQSFDGFEIILVDDGSTDGSAGICDDYAQRCGNVSVIHKKNGGLSDARNCGLDRAAGEYVLFVDSDDRLAPGALAALYSETHIGSHEASAADSDTGGASSPVGDGADVVIGRVKTDRPSSAMDRFERIAAERLEYHRVYTGAEYLIGCLGGGALRIEAWRSLYRRGFLLGGGLRFKVGITHEDEEFTPRVLLAARSVVLSDAEFYLYDNARTGSIMNSALLSPKKARDRMDTYEELLEIYGSTEPRLLRRLLRDDIAWKYMDCCRQYRLDRQSDIRISRTLPLRCAYHFKRRLRALAFAISPRLYVCL